MITVDDNGRRKESISSTDRHRLVRLRTKGEVEASNTTVDVYIVEIPTRSTSGVIEYERSKQIYLIECVLTGESLLRDIVPAKELQSLQHLRRIVKPEFLPVHLGHQNSTTGGGESADESPALSTVYLLVGPTPPTNHHQLIELLSKDDDLFAGLKLHLRTIPVPALAPTSAAQAAYWTEKYWPTVFRNTNPYGPHPSILRRAELELLADGGPEGWMNLAQQVARESMAAGAGIEVGAVILNRNSKGKKDAVVAAAGDFRRQNNTLLSNFSDVCGSGNVMGHAVMRAIGMVAKKRVLVDGNRLEEWAPSENGGERTPFLDAPMTPSEEWYFRLDSLDANGYLCLDLEIFVTHEPCLMCSMALLHSRFGRVVFGRRMPKTGALTAEGDFIRGKQSLGYGLFWRPVELNWRLLCWEFTGDDVNEEPKVPDDVHA